MNNVYRYFFDKQLRMVCVVIPLHSLFMPSASIPSVVIALITSGVEMSDVALVVPFYFALHLHFTGLRPSTRTFEQHGPHLENGSASLSTSAYTSTVENISALPFRCLRLLFIIRTNILHVLRLRIRLRCAWRNQKFLIASS